MFGLSGDAIVIALQSLGPPETRSHSNHEARVRTAPVPHRDFGTVPPRTTRSLMMPA